MEAAAGARRLCIVESQGLHLGRQGFLKSLRARREYWEYLGPGCVPGSARVDALNDGSLLIALLPGRIGALPGRRWRRSFFARPAGPPWGGISAPIRCCPPCGRRWRQSLALFLAFPFQLFHLSRTSAAALAAFALASGIGRRSGGFFL